MSSLDADLIVPMTRAVEDYAICTLDSAGRIVSWNRGAERFSGLTREEVIGKSLIDHVPPASVPPLARTMADAERLGSAEHEGWRTWPDGGRHWIDVVCVAIRDSSGELCGHGLIARDFTKRQADVQALRDSEERLRALTESTTDAIISTDEEGRIIAWNRAATALYGWSAEEVIGRRVEAIIPERLRGRAFAGLTEAASAEAARPFTRAFEVPARHRDGREVPVEVSISRWELGGRIHYTGIVRDITERKETERRLRHLADHDTLTGLLNGRRFAAELERVVSETVRYDRAAAVLVLDLDGFKVINDRHGHAAGDAVIGQLGRMLGEHIRESDVIGRLGGDEFGVILLEAARPQAELVAGEIVAQIAAHEFVLDDGARVRLSISVGVALFAQATGLTAAELMKEADRAMFEAKAAGRSTHVVSDGDSRLPATAPRSWSGELRRALDEDRFELHAQPIVPLRAGLGPRCEVLVRLREDDGSLLAPRAFLEDAERFELIGEIDRWVLSHAIALAHEWTESGRELGLSVNLAGPTLADLTIVRDIEAMLARHPLPPHALTIEIGETAAILDIARTGALTRELHALGCEVALDDFGSGFATLHYLDHLDVDVIKLAGAFVEGLLDRPTDQLIVRAMVDVAHGIGALTLAGCVGDEPTLERLREFGLDYAQGYHLGRPEPLVSTPIRSAAA